MKLSGKLKLGLVLCIPVVLLTTALAFVREYLPFSENLSIVRGDPHGDLKAMDALSSLMDRHPKASKYSVRWDKGGKNLAGYYYSVEKQNLLYADGCDLRSSCSMLDDTSVHISRDELKAAQSQSIHFGRLDGWLAKRRFSRMTPKE